MFIENNQIIVRNNENYFILEPGQPIQDGLEVLDTKALKAHIDSKPALKNTEVTELLESKAHRKITELFLKYDNRVPFFVKLFGGDSVFGVVLIITSLARIIIHGISYMYHSILSSSYYNNELMQLKNRLALIDNKNDLLASLRIFPIALMSTVFIGFARSDLKKNLTNPRRFEKKFEKWFINGKHYWRCQTARTLLIERIEALKEEKRKEIAEKTLKDLPGDGMPKDLIGIISSYASNPGVFLHLQPITP